MAARKKAAPKPALEQMAEVAAQPTLDELFKRDPKTHTPEDRRIMVEHFRAERAAWKTKEEKRAAKKEGVAPTGDDEEGRDEP